MQDPRLPEEGGYSFAAAPHPPCAFGGAFSKGLHAADRGDFRPQSVRSQIESTALPQVES